MNRFSVALVCAVGVTLAAGYAHAGASFHDDFDGASIDTTRWAFGGVKQGWDVDAGGWNFENTQVPVPAGDSYLRSAVHGPATANANSALAYVRTAANYNDGGIYAVNFRWGYEKNKWHWESLAIQVTNGDPPSITDWNTSSADGATWRNLYHRYDYDNGCPNQPTTDWSILIDAVNDTATLYAGPDFTGAVVGSKALDPSQPWHIQFVNADGTSGGFPDGDDALMLHSFDSRLVPEPGSLAFFGIAAGSLLLRRRN